MELWHMQMHPNEPYFSIEQLKNILNEKQVIGLWKEDEDTEVRLFKDIMQIGDLVLIRQGSIPIALVQVVSDMFIEDNPNEKFDWFYHRRKVKILKFCTDEEKNKYNGKTRGTIEHLKDPNTKTYNFIKECLCNYV